MSEDDSTKAAGPPRTSLGHIGPYKLLGVLGEGGMGVVYLAEQEGALRRRVALKVIKPGMDSRGVLARFEAERQALALLNHPNIAKVFDAGSTPEGHPFFVMEHIGGVPITEYCDRHRLTTRDRLGLFLQVCDAIQHAHGRGILHRDIKPSNVLVAEEDGSPVPKVIDFGVAKAIAHALTERTLFTEQGALLGTPEYMSPEQADGTGEGVDARTDVYSLGVLLYELLAGVPPLDPKLIRGAGYAEMQRMIREDLPPTPSEKISQMGAAAAEVSRNRKRDVRTLRRELRGDLDAIVGMSLSKDRRDRYPSARDLGEDVRRHLAGEGIRARRHRWAAGVGLLAAVGLVVVALSLALLRMSAAAGLERGGLGLLFRLRGVRPPPQEICIVAIDGASYSALHLSNTTRIPRVLQADLVRTLHREGARAIAFDVLFDEEVDADGDSRLAAAVREAGNVVLGVSIAVSDRDRPELRIGPYDALAEASASVGQVNFPVDPDGVARGVWLRRADVPSLSAAAFAVARRSPAPTDFRLIDHYGPAGTLPTVSFYQALKPEMLPPSFFHDRVVFVGEAIPPGVWKEKETTTPGLDSMKTPFGVMPGVEAHATVAGNLLEGRRLRLLPGFLETTLLVVFALVATLLLLAPRGKWATVWFLALEVLVWTLALAAFTKAGRWIPFMTISIVQLPVIYLVALARAVVRRWRPA